MPQDEALFRLPSDTEHTAIVGRTGSGKTQFGVWLLSQRSWNTRPWIVLDFKGDDLIGNIPHTKPLDIGDKIPKAPGVYVASPIVVDKEDREKLDQFFHAVWQRENVGVFVDEGYMATGLRWFRACLQQGRSKRVSMIVLSQRPVWMDRFVWSEASHMIAFDLSLKDDVDTANNMVPGYRQVKLPPFHSVWHDVKRRQTAILTPAPAGRSILSEYRTRSPVQRQAI